MEFESSTDGLSEQIAKYIAEQIITGELVEGERIQELRIVKELDVSRGSVREALLLLQRTYLIDIFPRRGAVVTELSTGQVKALFETGSITLGYIVQKMCETWRQTDSQRMQQLIQRLQQLERTGDIEAFYTAIFEFFTVQNQQLDNLYMRNIYQTLLPSLRRCYFLLLSTSRRELHEAAHQFNLVIEAILARKPQQATAFINDFCLYTSGLVIETLTKMKQVELAWAKRGHR